MTSYHTHTKLRFIILLTAWGILVGTYDLGSLSISLPQLIIMWHLDGLQQSFLGSSTLIGMVFGSIGAGVLADRFGRRSILLLDFATFIIAEVISATAPDYTVLLIARFIVGIGIGAEFATAFPYLSELIPAKTRGRIMASVMWAANFGMLAAYGVGAWCLHAGPSGWRSTLAIGALLATPLLFFRTILPESTAWQNHHITSLKEFTSTWKNKALRRMLLSNSSNWFFYQISDQGLSLFLPTFLMEQLGSSVVRGVLASLLVKAITIPAALLTVFLIDRTGRRPIQLWGFFGRTIGLFALAMLSISIPGTHKLWIILALIVTYAFGAFGPDKTTVILPAEQFPTEIRASGQGIAESMGRIGGITGVVGYALLSTTVSNSAGILLFAVAALIGWIITIYSTKETNHQSITFLQKFESTTSMGK
ncbi:MAG: MFS transporter [Acidibacillus sp.]|nr:MFS transporter [Acidibacillus sp.]